MVSVLTYLKKKYKKAIPKDLKDYVSLCACPGYCDECGEEGSVWLERETKKRLCASCHPLKKEYNALEYNEMWNVAREALYYLEKSKEANDITITRARILAVCPDRHIEAYLPGLMKWTCPTCGKRLIKVKKAREMGIYPFNTENSVREPPCFLDKNFKCEHNKPDKHSDRCEILADGKPCVYNPKCFHK
jgi:hypothetical protein